MIEIQFYRAKNDKEPFVEWYESIPDTALQLRIRKRIERISLGNFGDHKNLANNLYELRLDFGPGYRIYYAHTKKHFVLLLCGGDKSSQKRDIQKAQKYWLDYKERYL